MPIHSARAIVAQKEPTMRTGTLLSIDDEIQTHYEVVLARCFSAGGGDYRRGLLKEVADEIAVRRSDPDTHNRLLEAIASVWLVKHGLRWNDRAQRQNALEYAAVVLATIGG